MEYDNMKDKEIVINIVNGEACHGTHAKRDPASCSKLGKVSLTKLVGGILGLDGSGDAVPRVKPDDISCGSGEYPEETMELLMDKNLLEQQIQGSVSLVRKEHEKDKQKGGKANKAPKPPRHPKGPSLDAADMKLLKDISKTVMKKREKMERVKALKRMKAAGSPRASSSSSSLSSFVATISAMFVTAVFFLLLILQGLGSSTSSNLTSAAAPQPAPETMGLTPLEFYKAVVSDDGATPSFFTSQVHGLTHFRS